MFLSGRSQLIYVNRFALAGSDSIYVVLNNWAWFKKFHFWVTRAQQSRPKNVPILTSNWLSEEAAFGSSEKPSGSLKSGKAEQFEPMRMGFAGQQLCRAFANPLRAPTACKGSVVQEELQQTRVVSVVPGEARWTHSAKAFARPPAVQVRCRYLYLPQLQRLRCRWLKGRQAWRTV